MVPEDEASKGPLPALAFELVEEGPCLTGALAMRESDVVREHATTVMSTIRAIWPGLTDQDVQAMHAWNWSACCHRGTEAHTGASVTRFLTHWWHGRREHREEIVR